MDLTFLPSLQHMVSVRIASRLIQEKDILNKLNAEANLHTQLSPFNSSMFRLRESIENSVVEKLPLLPPKLAKRVANCIPYMYCDLKRWFEDNDLPIQNVSSFYIKVLSWKTDGSVKGQETAKKCLQGNDIPFRNRFVIACNYCFQDEIVRLWNEKTSTLWYRIFGGDGITGTNTNPAIRLWMKLLKDGDTELFHERVAEHFETDLFRRHDIPLRLISYFHYLTKTSRRKYLHPIVHHHQHDLCSCLQQLDETESMEYVQYIPSNPTSIVFECLQWPVFESVFLKVVKQLAPHMAVDDFRHILTVLIMYHLSLGLEYVDLFKDFWNIIPLSHRDDIQQSDRKFNSYQLVLSIGNATELNSLVEILSKHFDTEDMYEFVRFFATNP